jgi:hypothetical protein
MSTDKENARRVIDRATDAVRDATEIPLGARNKLEFIWLERVDDAIAAALEGAAT